VTRTDVASSRTAVVDDAWARTGEQTLGALEVDPAEGLTGGEAARRLEEIGGNDLHLERALPLWRSVLGQLRETMILVLLAALTLTLLIGDVADAAVIALVVAVNTTVGVAQERRAANAVAALRGLAAPTARVRRGGAVMQVPAQALVPGDVLVVQDGDVVGADARLVAGHALEVDESLLTGESTPSGRSADASVPVGAPVGDRVTMLHAGTTVSHGRGEAVVVATGGRSQVGGIAALLSAGSPPVTPLQLRLRRLGRGLSAAAVAACVLVAVLGLARGQDWQTMMLIGISLAIAGIPESLPAVVALALAGGAHRMAQRGAIVRSLPAVETLGSVTLLATDKTGTLTRGAMECVTAWTPEAGSIDLVDHVDHVDPADPDGLAVPASVRDLLAAASLCNDAPVDGRPGSRGTEGAIVRTAQAHGVDVEAARRLHPRLREVPFDAVRRSMQTWHRTSTSTSTSTRAITKGAPEVVFADVPQGREHAAAVVQDWSRQGRRVLAVVTQDDAAQPRLLGLLALADPLRPEARDAILACRGAGITPVLVTGDHAGTARAIARATGITDEDPGDPDRESPSVRARIDPAGKLALIEAWQAQGHVVAMTGDGVNDAPALRAADVGVSMGLRGTDVAKQAADIVLTDDSLATVVAAVSEGRRVYDNIRRFVRYGVAGGMAEVAVMLVGPFIGLALPLLPGQILWVNLVTHGLPGVAIGGEAAEDDVGRRPPRPTGEGIVTRTMAAEIAVIAAVIAATCLVVGGWASGTDRPWQSMLFVTLALAQLGVAVTTRSTTKAFWRVSWSANPLLGVAVVASAAMTIGALYVGPLAALLRTTPLTAGDLAIAVLAAAVPAVVIEVLKGHRAGPGRRGRDVVIGAPGVGLARPGAAGRGRSGRGSAADPRRR